MTQTFNTKNLLSFGFGVLIVLMITIIVIGLSRMVKINDSLDKIVQESNRKVTITTDMYNAARERALLLHIILLEPDPFLRDEFIQEHAVYANRYVTARGILTQQNLDQREKDLLQIAFSAVLIGAETQNKVLEMIEQESFDEARIYLNEVSLPAQKKVLVTLKEILEYQIHISDINAKHAQETYESAWRLMLFLGLATILLALAIAITVVRVTVRFEKLQLEAKNTALQSAQTKSDFLANMSHEIRTPLNAIIGMSGVLRNTPLTTKQDDFVGTIVTSSETLLGVVNDVLDFSKIEAGQMTLEHRVFDLRACITDVLQMQSSKAVSKNIKCTSLIQNQAPNHVIGDELRLRQVLLNLVGNAIKFTERGEVIIDVSSHTLDESQVELTFKIKDTGIGIAKDRISQLFNSFTQADSSTTRRYGGTGLGLSISQNIVGLMGSKITIDSIKGVGSTFQFSIKMDYEETQIDVPVETKVNQNEIHVNTIDDAALAFKPDPELALKMPLSILLVEDIKVNQQVALLLLEQLGYKADVAENGQQAVDAVSHKHYDLVFMDIQMPVMDGLSATKAIRQLTKLERQPYISAMTANALESHQEECIDMGMDDYLSKPIELFKLSLVLQRAFQKKPLEIDDSYEKTIVTTADLLVEEDYEKTQKVDIQLDHNDTLNFDALNQLQQMMGGSQKAIKDLLYAYLLEAPNQVNDIVEFYQQEKWQKLSRAGHGLKSSSATLGALKLSDLAKCLEDEGKKNDELPDSEAWSDVSQYILDLQTEYKRVDAAINLYLSEN